VAANEITVARVVSCQHFVDRDVAGWKAASSHQSSFQDFPFLDKNLPGGRIQHIVNVRPPSSFWIEELADIRDFIGEIGVTVSSVPSLANFVR
jgi:hypothetical protein